MRWKKAICFSTFSLRWGTTRVPYPEEDKKTAIECVDELDRKMPFSVEPCKSWQQSTKITTHLQKCILGCPNKKSILDIILVDCCFLNSNLSVKTLDVEGTNINVLRPFDQLHDPIRVWKMWWFFAWVSEPYGQMDGNTRYCDILLGYVTMYIHKNIYIHTCTVYRYILITLKHHACVKMWKVASFQIDKCWCPTFMDVLWQGLFLMQRYHWGLLNALFGHSLLPNCVGWLLTVLFFCAHHWCWYIFRVRGSVHPCVDFFKKRIHSSA